MRNRITRGVFVLLSVLLGCHCKPANAQGFADNPAYLTARGPISLRDMRPYNLLFLQFLPESGDTLLLHRTQFSLQFDIANNLLTPAANGGLTVHEDNEYQRLLAAWRYGIGRGTEIGVFVPLEWRNAGILDGLLNAYHRLVGISGNVDDPIGRTGQPQNKSTLQLTDASGNLLVNQGNGFGLGETTLTVKRSLFRATPRSAAALRFGLKLPTGNPALLLGSGSFDAGVSLDMRYCVGREVILYANVGQTVMGPSPVPGSRRTMFQAFAGIEYRPNNRDSFILQVDGSSLAVRTGNGLADKAQTTLTFGYRRVLDRHLVGFLAFAENGDINNYDVLAFGGVGPDVTFSAGLEWRN